MEEEAELLLLLLVPPAPIVLSPARDFLELWDYQTCSQGGRRHGLNLIAHHTARPSMPSSAPRLTLCFIMLLNTPLSHSPEVVTESLLIQEKKSL